MNTVIAMSGGSFTNSNRRRVLEKSRIQKLKSWHENVKKIARSEMDFIASIFKDENDKDSENRDWLRDYESDDEGSEGNREVVKADP
jgi:hypothetical protein